MGGYRVTLVGDWKKASVITNTMVQRFKKASDMATRREAELLRAHMVKGIRSGAPGGKTFAPLAASTIRARKFTGRGGSKPLIQTGGLVGSIRVKKFPGDIYFVGILKTAEGGKANIAEMNEFGATIAARLTLKSLRFLRAMGRKFGDTKSSGSSRVVKPASGGGIGIVIIRIPPRPFVGPTAEAHAKPRDVSWRFRRNLAHLMGGTFGFPTSG